MRPRAAVRLLDKARATYGLGAKKSAIALRVSAHLHGELGLHREALQLYAAMPQGLREDPMVAAGHALSLFEAGSYAAALAIHEKLGDHALAARDYGALGRHAEARGALLRLLKQRPAGWLDYARDIEARGLQGFRIYRPRLFDLPAGDTASFPYRGMAITATRLRQPPSGPHAWSVRGLLHRSEVAPAKAS